MRDINRIDTFLEQLGNIWKTKCPDWRFGQLMVNVFAKMDNDPFFPEEDEMLNYITNFFENK